MIGNSGRPYYKCTTDGCSEFFSFDDYGGISEGNPPCHCGRPSRRRVGGKAPFNSSYLVLQCATGACEYKEPESGATTTVRVSEIPQWRQDGRL